MHSVWIHYCIRFPGIVESHEHKYLKNKHPPNVLYKIEGTNSPHSLVKAPSENPSTYYTPKPPKEDT